MLPEEQFENISPRKYAGNKRKSYIVVVPVLIVAERGNIYSTSAYTGITFSTTFV